jgi:hypothetical protein
MVGLRWVPAATLIAAVLGAVRRRSWLGCRSVNQLSMIGPPETPVAVPARDREPINDIEAGLISLDRPRTRDEVDTRDARHGCRRYRQGMSMVLEWGLAAALFAAVVIAADMATPRVRDQPGAPPLASTDPTGPHTRGMAPMIATHPQAVAGEQITVLVTGVVLGTRGGGMCGVVYLRFDGRPVDHTVQYLRLDPSLPDITSTAAMIVPPDAATGEHEIGLYLPVVLPNVRSGADCAEEREHEASIAVASIIVVTAVSGSPAPASSVS